MQCHLFPTVEQIQFLSVDNQDGLELTSQYHSDKPCISVDHHSITGDILIGSAKGIRKLDRATGMISDLSTIYPYAKIIEYKGAVFIASISNVDQKLSVFKYSLQTTSSKIVFSFPANYTPNTSIQIGVSDPYIVCWDSYHETLRIFEMTTNRLMTHPLPKCKQLGSLLITPNGLLYATIKLNG